MLLLPGTDVSRGAPGLRVVVEKARIIRTWPFVDQSRSEIDQFLLRDGRNAAKLPAAAVLAGKFPVSISFGGTQGALLCRRGASSLLQKADQARR
ncbi:hypothetical protein JVX91_09320 [Pseudomonas sp. PDNC002]|uniref:hypothetical protein n=1 Tax=Pseudomonas sp. PDNC002 TaxID=2811422 RepID=UPI0019637DA1|nr:hypothetical protein [Pseudomonas sp. PDNC002]QRY81281.1 hypothetical protein JVX91_09320 [Pseudomonas sp. PDNC002]